jgi:hypothetical protein
LHVWEVDVNLFKHLFEKDANFEIKYWQPNFRCLDDWRIVYKNPPDDPRDCRSWVDYANKTAWIYPCRGIYNVHECKCRDGRPSRYIFHEILHIALAVMRGKRRRSKLEFDAEEVLVQDLTELFWAAKDKA